MNKDPNQPTNNSYRSDRAVVLLPTEAAYGGGGGIDYAKLFNVVWRGKWIVIAVTAVFAVASVFYALAATQWYRAEVVMVPARSPDALQGQLGNLAGLASLAGVNIGQQADSTEALAVLRSREFVSDFIEEQNLMPVLFADKWDATEGKWKGDPKKSPDVRDGVKLFENQVRRIVENKRAGLISLSIEWKDSATAADWANLLVERANERMRQRAQAEAEVNVQFLKDELASTNVVTLQQSIGRLLESELQTLMLARYNKEFAFRVVDQATPPKWRSKPKRTLLVILATMAGGIFSLLVVFGREAVLASRRGARGDSEPTFGAA